jgi:transposase InsO family protein
MDLKLEFITRLNQGESMTDLCVEYGIARKTGHKLKARYEAQGALGLLEQSRAPKSIPHKTPPEVVALIIAERHKHPSWGPKKLKDVLERRLGVSLPSANTLGHVLARAGLVERRKTRARHKSMGTGLRVATAPNDLWCIDYKGQFRLGNGSYCYPLTVTDQYSRYLLGCEGMAAISDEGAREVCEDLFRANGLPAAIRSDNGTPFASTGLAGLTKLSAYWLRLGIALERIKPAHPEQNGAHERMHRTLKRETARPARTNLLQQQERFDEFAEEYNCERPHEALEMRRPAEVYQPSTRAYPAALPELNYPGHDDALRVNEKGNLYLSRRGLVYLSAALAGYQVGIREEDDGRLLVSFLDIDLGHIALDRAFVPKTSNPPEAH